VNASAGPITQLFLDEKVALLIFEYSVKEHRWQMTQAMADLLRDEIGTSTFTKIHMIAE
jgi:hypothetical protein